MRPYEMRMARAAAGWTLMETGKRLGVSAAAICKFEKSGEGLGRNCLDEAERLFRAERIYIIPHGVCVGQNAYEQERAFALGLFGKLQEHGLVPASGEIIQYAKRLASESQSVENV